MSYEPQVWVDGAAGGTPLSAARLNHIEAGIVQAAAAPTFNVRNFGAHGNGKSDDTTAFQRALTAAARSGGTVVIPQPSHSWIISRTLLIQPVASQSQGSLDIQGSGQAGAIQWRGGSNAPVFRCHGWKRSRATGVHLDFTNSRGNHNIGWDIDTTAAQQSTSVVTFENCFVGLGPHVGNVGWRLGHVSAGIGDISFFTWVNCNVNGVSGVPGQRGWLNEGQNTLNNSWFGGYGGGLETMVSNLSGRGAASAQGDDSMFFYGLGGTRNALDFEFANRGAYLISGGRFELGKTFLLVTRGTNHASVTVQGINISSYSPTHGTLVGFQRPGSLVWDGNYVSQGIGHRLTGAAFNLGGSGGVGSMSVRGGALQAPDPFWTNSARNWEVFVQGVGRLTAQGRTPSRMRSRIR